MRKKFVIGLDGGTQSSKVVIFDLEGNIVCQGKKDLQPMHMPKPGVAEHPGDDFPFPIYKGLASAMPGRRSKTCPHDRHLKCRNCEELDGLYHLD